MTKYTVKIAEVYTTEVEIWADNEDEARSLAEGCLNSGLTPEGEDLPESHYDYTLDKENWIVYE